MSMHKAESSMSELRMKRVQKVKEAIAALAKGQTIIVQDADDREDEGDFVCAAAGISAESVARMAREGRGLICHAIDQRSARRLLLPAMVQENTDRHGTAFTVSVDAREGTTTGISASDRARTMRLVADPSSRPEQLRRPGHVFPLVARPGGVFERQGHTEAAVDLSRLAGFEGGAAICEILNEDGHRADSAQLRAIAEKYEMVRIHIDDLIVYRDAVGDVELDLQGPVRLPTPLGEFALRSYRSSDPACDEFLVLSITSPESGAESGTPEQNEAPLVRLHSECVTGEVLGSLRCDCGPQLDDALRRIAEQGGHLVYLKQEGRGIGLHEKIKAYGLQDHGADTLQANLELGHPGDARRYGAAIAALAGLGVTKVRLLSNNPEKISAFTGSEVTMAERVAIEAGSQHENHDYLETKRLHMGHLLRGIAG